MNRSVNILDSSTNILNNSTRLNTSKSIQHRSITPTRANLSTATQKSKPVALNASSTNTSLVGKSQRTPNKRATVATANSSVLGLTRAPSFTRTPGKTPNKTNRTLGLTPSRNCNISSLNLSSVADRFITSRSETNFELGEHLFADSTLRRNNSSVMGSKSAPHSPAKDSQCDVEYENAMRQRLNAGISNPSVSDGENAGGDGTNMAIADATGYRILAFQKGQAPKAPVGYPNAMKALYTSRAVPASSCQKSVRQIPKMPDRILDAPEFEDDYYLNLIDWGSRNLVCVALGGQVFLWNADSGGIESLYEMEPSSTDKITSVQFTNDASYCALGLSTGEIHLYDVNTRVRLRIMREHDQRVPCLAWSQHVLTSGCRTGQIHHSDVRIAEHHTGTLTHHAGEVCSLRYSPDGRYLASGSNDNTAAVWTTTGNTSVPVHVIDEHQAAVKALAWCPWQTSLLATGGGQADQHIRMCNVQSGAQLTATNTGSQVSAIIWSDHHRELLSGHGYPNNQLIIHKYPSMKVVAELKGHEQRILSVVQSPCGQYVMSAASDETLRLWHCFAIDSKKTTTATPKTMRSAMSTGGAGIVRTLR